MKLPHAVLRYSDRLRFRIYEDQRVGGSQDPNAMVDLLKTFNPRSSRRLYLNQQLGEWGRFMDFLSARGFPNRILEIGTGLGGTSYFFSRLANRGSTVVTVDIAPAAEQFVGLYNRRAYPRTKCVVGNSHDHLTVEEVTRVLGSGPVDLLYIDGDHSYEGVARDFELYQRFCREGTLVAFHDIVPDWRQTRGIPTDADSGQVWRLWRELRSRYRHWEFVEQEDQDGFGIGVIEY